MRPHNERKFGLLRYQLSSRHLMDLDGTLRTIRTSHSLWFLLATHHTNLRYPFSTFRHRSPARRAHRPKLRAVGVCEHVLIAPLAMLWTRVRSLLSADAAVAVHLRSRQKKTGGYPATLRSTERIERRALLRAPALAGAFGLVAGVHSVRTWAAPSQAPEVAQPQAVARLAAPLRWHRS